MTLQQLKESITLIHSLSYKETELQTLITIIDKTADDYETYQILFKKYLNHYIENPKSLLSICKQDLFVMYDNKLLQHLKPKYDELNEKDKVQFLFNLGESDMIFTLLGVTKAKELTVNSVISKNVFNMVFANHNTLKYLMVHAPIMFEYAEFKNIARNRICDKDTETMFLTLIKRRFNSTKKRATDSQIIKIIDFFNYYFSRTSNIQKLEEAMKECGKEKIFYKALMEMNI